MWFFRAQEPRGADISPAARPLWHIDHRKSQASGTHHRPARPPMRIDILDAGDTRPLRGDIGTADRDRTRSMHPGPVAAAAAYCRGPSPSATVAAHRPPSQGGTGKKRLGGGQRLSSITWLCDTGAGMAQVDRAYSLIEVRYAAACLRSAPSGNGRIRNRSPERLSFPLSGRSCPAPSGLWRGGSPGAECHRIRRQRRSPGTATRRPALIVVREGKSAGHGDARIIRRKKGVQAREGTI